MTATQEGTLMFPGLSAAVDHTTGVCQGRQIQAVMARVGDKWSMCVVGALYGGTVEGGPVGVGTVEGNTVEGRPIRGKPVRFNELRRRIVGISQRMLTLTLRGLERDGLVTRTVYPTNPPSVDYALTDLGRTLILPVLALAQWSEAHLLAIHQARDRFDRRQIQEGARAQQ